jgi:membrane protein DedA with SNARE-associated domain
VVLVGGLAAQHGYLWFPLVIAVAWVGAFVGDQVFFFIGRRYGNRLLARFPRLARRAPRVHALLQRWDILAVLLVRFLYGLRTVGPIVIGASGIPAWRLALLNVNSALTWACLVASIGYFAGQALERWGAHLEKVGVLLLMTAALAAAALWLLRQWRRR